MSGYKTYYIRLKIIILKLKKLFYITKQTNDNLK